MSGSSNVNSDSQIDNLNQEVTARDSQIDSLNQEVTARDGQISGLNNQISIERDLQFSQPQPKDAKIQEFEESTSWKLTRPLRFCKQIAQHAKRAGNSFVRWVRPSPAPQLTTETVSAAAMGNDIAENVDLSWAEFDRQVLTKRHEFKGIFVQESTIDWNVPLYQRPQHMCAAFGRRGYLVLFKIPKYSSDQVAGVRNVAPNVWLTSCDDVDKIEGAVHSIYSTDYFKTPELLSQIHSSQRIVYEYIDHIDPQISGDMENVRRLNAVKDFAFGGGVDHIVASSLKLEAEAIEAVSRDKTVLVQNGVDAQHYRNPVHQSTPLPEELISFREKYSTIVGYFGALAPWLWYEAISKLVKLRPEVGFIFIGPDYFGGSDKLPVADNVLCLGTVDYKILPAYARQFDVCFIPFMPGEIAHTTSPLKLFEYFALEKPVVVTSEMLECVAFKEVFSGDSASTLSQAIDAAVQIKNDSDFKKRLSQLADENDWDMRAKAMEIVFEHDLLKHIVATHAVSQQFVEMYFERQKFESFRAYSWDSFLEELDPLKRMHVEFALSTVSRGRAFANLLESNLRIHNKRRYLDVGTGYGGFLRAFNECGFEEVVGIELQEFLCDYAKANVSDIQHAQVLNVDFEKCGASLGKFDLVTCNDVIEHVDDPALTIQKMAGLVADDGYLCLEAPNDDCILFVKSDGHFQIHGLTQLVREDAATYYSETLGMTRENYLFEMGESHEMGWYIERMAENGLRTHVIDTVNVIGGIGDVPRLIADLKHRHQEWRQHEKSKLNIATSEVVEAAMDAYIAKLERDFNSLSDDVSIKEFTDKYLRTFWTLVGHKKFAS